MDKYYRQPWFFSIPSAYYLFEEGDFSANFGLNLKSLVDEIRGIT